MENKETKVNSGHYQILGTDKFDDGEKSFSKEYFEYRKKWQDNPKQRIVGDFPLHLDIESTNNCNLKCTMCGRNWMKEKLGFIDFDLFKKIIDEASKYKLPSIKLNYRGEPLLHPDLPKMVKYAKDKGILEVQFNTNGLLLSEEKAEELIDAGLDRIIFSFDGATKETYEKIRRGSDYDKVIKNIKYLVSLRNKKGLKRPLVRVQMVKMTENAQEVEEFIKMWTPIANKVAISTVIDFLAKECKENEHFPCPQIYQRLMICWDGEVRMCCGDWYGKFGLDNVKERSLYDIWHGEKINRVRKLHSEGKFNEVPACASCEVNTPRSDSKVEEIVNEWNTREK